MSRYNSGQTPPEPFTTESPPQPSHPEAPVDCDVVADFLRVVAHPHRIQILLCLTEQDRAVAWLAQELQLQPHVASSHLRLMQRAGVVKGIRTGKFVHYRIHDKRVTSLVEWMRACGSNPRGRPGSNDG